MFYASSPSSSINLTTVLMTSLSARSRAGSCILRAMTSSTMARRREMRTPILAQPRRRSQLSTYEAAAERVEADRGAGEEEEREYVECWRECRGEACERSIHTKRDTYE